MNEVLDTRYNRLIIVLSVVIPLAVAALFGIKVEGYDFSFLPPIYASINGLTALLLVMGVIAIKKGNRSLHENLMKTCIGLSALFLWRRGVYQICLFFYLDYPYYLIYCNHTDGTLYLRSRFGSTF